MQHFNKNNHYSKPCSLIAALVFLLGFCSCSASSTISKSAVDANKEAKQAQVEITTSIKTINEESDEGKALLATVENLINKDDKSGAIAATTQASGKFDDIKTETGKIETSLKRLVIVVTKTETIIKEVPKVEDKTPQWYWVVGIVCSTLILGMVVYLFGPAIRGISSLLGIVPKQISTAAKLDAEAIENNSIGAVKQAVAIKRENKLYDKAYKQAQTKIRLDKVTQDDDEEKSYQYTSREI